jgi:hypothetical protein
MAQRLLFASTVPGTAYPICKQIFQIPIACIYPIKTFTHTQVLRVIINEYAGVWGTNVKLKGTFPIPFFLFCGFEA